MTEKSQFFGTQVKCREKVESGKKYYNGEAGEGCGGILGEGMVPSDGEVTSKKYAIVMVIVIYGIIGGGVWRALCTLKGCSP
jgi:hypothetical protein